MAIYLVVLISTISQMGFGGSRVAVSLYALELGANQFTVGVIVALYSLSPMFFSIVIGRVSDRVSPHWPMIIGSVMMMVALLIPVASPSLVMLCVLAFLNGLGHLIFSIPLEAAVGGVGGGRVGGELVGPRFDDQPHHPAQVVPRRHQSWQSSWPIQPISASRISLIA